MPKLSTTIRHIMQGPGTPTEKRAAIEEILASENFISGKIVDDRTDVNAANAEVPTTGLADNTLVGWPKTHGALSAGIMGTKDLAKGASKTVAQVINNLSNILPFGNTVSSDNTEGIRQRLQPSNPIQMVGGLAPDIAISFMAPSGVMRRLASKVPALAKMSRQLPNAAKVLNAGADSAAQSLTLSGVKGSDSVENDAEASALIGAGLKTLPIGVEKGGTAIAKYILRNLDKSNGDEKLVDESFKALMKRKPQTPGVLGRLGNALTGTQKFSQRMRNRAELANDESNAFTKVSQEANDIASESAPHITKSSLRNAHLHGTEGARMPSSQLREVNGYDLPKLGRSITDLKDPKLLKELDQPKYASGQGMIRTRLAKINKATDFRKFDIERDLRDPVTGELTGKKVPDTIKAYPNRLNGEIPLPVTPEHKALTRRVNNEDVLALRNELVDSVRNADIAAKGEQSADALSAPLLSRIQPGNQASFEKQLTALLSKNKDIAGAIAKRDNQAKRLEFMQEVVHNLQPVAGKEAIAVSRMASGIGAAAPVYTAAAGMSAHALRGARHLAQTGSSEGRFNAIMDSLRRTIPALNNN